MCVYGLVVYLKQFIANKQKINYPNLTVMSDKMSYVDVIKYTFTS